MAWVAALTIFGCLRPLDKQLENLGVSSILKISSARPSTSGTKLYISVLGVVCSDSVYSKAAVDSSGKEIIARLSQHGISDTALEVVPDELYAIRQKAGQLSKYGIKLLIFTGGTGLSSRDVTPEALAPLIDRRIDGIMETARAYGQEHMGMRCCPEGLQVLSAKCLYSLFPVRKQGQLNTWMQFFLMYCIFLTSIKGKNISSVQ